MLVSIERREFFVYEQDIDNAMARAPFGCGIMVVEAGGERAKQKARAETPRRSVPSVSVERSDAIRNEN